MTLNWQMKEISKWNTPVITFRVTKYMSSDKKLAVRSEVSVGTVQ